MKEQRASSPDNGSAKGDDGWTIETVIERRAGIACAVQRRETHAAILMPWDELRGPLSIAPALEYVRDHRRFRVSDLPRLRDDASRLVLARALVRSGLVRVAADQTGSDRAPVEVPATGRAPKDRKGSLIVVGSGIKSIAHLTLETESWLRRADVIVYLVSDPATETWIKKMFPGSIDLAVLYSKHIQRSDVYQAMVEQMMGPVRQGKTVCSIFYGHPGVFVTPTHNAIEAARAEGYAARMLPGISAADCLYADLGFNPSDAGAQAYEATDLLVHNRALHPENNVVIWQIGLVGNPTSTDDASQLPVLVEYLQQFYDPDCEVVHYQGSVFSVCDPVIERLPLRELGTGAKVTNMSTLFIPPQRKPQLDMAMMRRLGLLADASTTGASAEAARPPAYEEISASSALADFVTAAATDAALLVEFEQDPEGVAARAVLSEDERGALVTRMPGRIWAAIRHPPAREAELPGRATPAEPAAKPEVLQSAEREHDPMPEQSDVVPEVSQRTT